MNTLNSEDILNNLRTGIYVVGINGEYLFLNDAMERITGATKKEVLHTNVTKQIDAQNFEYSISLRAAKEKKPLSMIQTVHSPYKTYQQLVYAKPTFDEHGDVLFVTVEVNVLNDIRERYQQAIMADSTDKIDSYCLHNDMSADDIICVSEITKDVFRIAARLAPSHTSILITGETGTGKNRLASYIHENSTRSAKKMVSVNCAALPGNLLESELFGYAKGAFTGASSIGRSGLLDDANGGTLFLDEINSLPFDLQGKLLSALETRQYKPIGSNQVKYSDFRLICASNESLKELVKNGSFRSDLYYRINVVPIHMPSLADRKEDIIPLSNYYCAFFSGKNNVVKVLSSEMCKKLENYAWPGNVRQLKNVIERLVVMTPRDKIEIEESFFPLIEESFELGLRSSADNYNYQLVTKEYPAETNITSESTLKEAVESYERDILRSAFKKYKSTYKVAEALRTSQSTIARKKLYYGI